MSASASGQPGKEIVIKGVSSIDEPSVKWGWHGFDRRVASIVGICFAAFLLLMNIGNHIGHIEDIYLTAIAIAILVVIIGTWKPAPPRDSSKRNKIFTPADPLHYTKQ